MAKIEAPNTGYNGTGPGAVKFEDGIGHTDDEAALNYYRAAGYTVDGEAPYVPVTADEVDPREVTTQVVGTSLRDAAVDPAPGDFLPPVNAGEANPHGSEVVSPQVHADGPKGIRPGVVGVDDLSVQAEAEARFAEARLIDQVPMSQAVKAEVPDVDARGELGLSDPGSATASDAVDEKPAKSAPKAAWVDHAVLSGAERDEAEALTKAELVEQYG